MNKKEKFEKNLLKLSLSTNYEQAKKEWVFKKYSATEEICVCGQHLQRHLIFVNKVNNNKAIIGSSCADKFIDVKIGVNFTNGLKKLQTNKYAIISYSLLMHLHDNELITDNDIDEYQEKKWDKVKEINEILLAHIGVDIDTFFEQKELDFNPEIAENIEKLIEIAKNNRGNFLKKFSKSIKEQFTERGTLSKKQLDILHKYVL
ncbi:MULTISPECIES: hypothetical protein [Sphingobacterium]|uniref:hypothetical protein n=1 Tax=Sphingobacterium TaxID=28453 RepID=UPI00257E6AA0|nr:MULTISPECIES: hypothetical protein [Sphingobacterium]